MSKNSIAPLKLWNWSRFDLEPRKLNMKVCWSFTYHNLCKFSIEFAFLWHWLRKVLKELHSPRMINAIANFRVIGARAKTTNATSLSRHFMKPVLSVFVKHGFKLTIKPFGKEVTALKGKQFGKIVSRFVEWPTKTAHSRYCSEGAQIMTV